MDEAENLHCHSGAFHQLDGAAMHSVTSKRILKKMHFHAATRPFRQRLSESVRDFAFPEQEIFECDRALRRTNGLQHCREDVIAVFQGCNLVAFDKRRAKQVTHGSDECIVAD